MQNKLDSRETKASNKQKFHARNYQILLETTAHRMEDKHSEKLNQLDKNEIDNFKRTWMHNFVTMAWLRSRYVEKAKLQYLFFPEELHKHYEINQLFRGFDYDESNGIEISELINMFKDNNVFLDRDEIAEIFKLIDFNGDNTLNLSEFKKSVFSDSINQGFARVMRDFREKFNNQEAEKKNKEMDNFYTTNTNNISLNVVSPQPSVSAVQGQSENESQTNVGGGIGGGGQNSGELSNSNICSQNLQSQRLPYSGTSQSQSIVSLNDSQDPCEEVFQQTPMDTGRISVKTSENHKTSMKNLHLPEDIELKLEKSEKNVQFKRTLNQIDTSNNNMNQNTKFQEKSSQFLYLPSTSPTKLQPDKLTLNSDKTIKLSDRSIYKGSERSYSIPKKWKTIQIKEKAQRVIPTTFASMVEFFSYNFQRKEQVLKCQKMPSIQVTQKTSELKSLMDLSSKFTEHDLTKINKLRNKYSYKSFNLIDGENMEQVDQIDEEKNEEQKGDDIIVEKDLDVRQNDGENDKERNEEQRRSEEKIKRKTRSKQNNRNSSTSQPSFFFNPLTQNHLTPHSPSPLLASYNNPIFSNKTQKTDNISTQNETDKTGKISSFSHTECQESLDLPYLLRPPLDFKNQPDEFFQQQGNESTLEGKHKKRLSLKNKFKKLDSTSQQQQQSNILGRTFQDSKSMTPQFFSPSAVNTSSSFQRTNTRSNMKSLTPEKSDNLYQSTELFLNDKRYSDSHTPEQKQILFKMKDVSSNNPGNSQQPQISSSSSSSTILNNFYKLNATLTNKNHFITTDGFKQQQIATIPKVEVHNNQKSFQLFSPQNHQEINAPKETNHFRSRFTSSQASNRYYHSPVSFNKLYDNYRKQKIPMKKVINNMENDFLRQTLSKLNNESDSIKEQTNNSSDNSSSLFIGSKSVKGQGNINQNENTGVTFHAKRRNKSQPQLIIQTSDSNSNYNPTNSTQPSISHNSQSQSILFGTIQHLPQRSLDISPSKNGSTNKIISSQSAAYLEEQQDYQLSSILAKTKENLPFRCIPFGKTNKLFEKRQLHKLKNTLIVPTQLQELISRKHSSPQLLSTQFLPKSGLPVTTRLQSIGSTGSLRQQTNKNLSATISQFKTSSQTGKI